MIVPLGIPLADLGDVAEARATIAYQPPAQGEKVTLPLGDQPSETSHGDAQATAKPIAAADTDGKSDHAWRISLSSDGHHYYWTNINKWSAMAKATPSARIRLVLPPENSWLSPAAEILLARVDNPDTRRRYIRVEADKESLDFPLVLSRHGGGDAPVHRYHVTFRDPLRRYRVRAFAPPATRTLDVPVKTDIDLSLDAAAPVADGHGGLRLDLPIGLGDSCELNALTKKDDAPLLVWRKRERAPNPRMQRWQVTTLHGDHAVIDGLSITTRLYCPCVPEWQTTPVTGDTPWLIDLEKIRGVWRDPLKPADAFDTVQFLDADNQPLSPMRKDARPDEPAIAWRDERAKSTRGDYVYDDGLLRVWGNAARVVFLDFDGRPYYKTWHSSAAVH